MAPLTAATLLAAAVWVLLSAPVLGRSVGGGHGASRRTAAWAWVAAAGVVGWTVGVRPRLWLLVGAAVCVLLVTRWLTSARGRRNARRRHQRAVVELCDALAAELEAGLPAAAAVQRACPALPEWAGISQAARLGSDVAGALRSTARHSGAEGLRAVAAAWDVAQGSGAALSMVLDRVGDGLRADEDARAEATAALGPPRATARLLAALPLMGLGLGVSMGAQPTSFLLGTPTGLACLGAGVLLAGLGVAWVDRLAAAAES